MTHHESIPQPASTCAGHDDRYRLAMQASRTGMAIIGAAGELLDVNPALARMLGYRADELVGRPAATLAHPDDDTAPGTRFADLLAGAAASNEAPRRCAHRGGSDVWVQASVDIVRNGADGLHCRLLQLRDISAQRLQQAQQAELAAEQAEALAGSHRQLQLFADAVSHDLRAPLRAIESFSGLLASRAADRLDDTDLDYLRRIRAGAQRMGGLLAALTELSGVLRAELKPTDVDLSLLADWVGAELRDSEPERSAQIAVQPGLVGWGDERLLKQLLTHLMGNAWKFSRDCDTTLIEIGGHSDHGALVLTVRDAGIGFDTDYAHKLFEPFQRLHGPDQGGGHGLGLAIAQRIVQRHGGCIRGDAPAAGGALFVVELPAAKAAEDAPNA